MSGFLSAHGYDPGPTQRPYLAGGVSGTIATVPALIILHGFGSLEVEADILGMSLAATVSAGCLAMAAAGGLYARLFGRAGNDARDGWLLAMAFGFVLWSAGAVMLLPLISGGLAPAGMAALGVFLSFLGWGAALGLLLPFVHRPLHGSIASGTRQANVGPLAAVRKRPRARK